MIGAAYAQLSAVSYGVSDFVGGVAARRVAAVRVLLVSYPVEVVLLAALAAGAPDAPWPLGLTAVIEAQDGHLSYWALHHPAAQPDFHHRGGWTARVPAPHAA